MKMTFIELLKEAALFSTLLTVLAFASAALYVLAGLN